jgi:cysteinyl-tRNA synthetase, unknown class
MGRMKQRKLLIILAAACIFTLFFGCISFSKDYIFTLCLDEAAGVEPIYASADLDIISWCYALQDDVPGMVEDTTFDCVVMDYSEDGSENSVFSKEDIASVKNGGERIVLSYLSIGEAEDYRYYFDEAWINPQTGQPGFFAPCWLCLTNEAWEGNYKVQYWSTAWQNNIFDYLEKIMEAGFDGVYLDIIDGFEYWSDTGNGEGYSIEEEDAAEKMINFIYGISREARELDRDFIIILQNGENIFEYDNDGKLMKTIDGIAVEDLYYDERDRQDEDDTDYRIEYLEMIIKKDKPVLVVDYTVTSGSDAVVEDFIDRARNDGFLPYAAHKDRELDEIITFPGQGE